MLQQQQQQRLVIGTKQPVTSLSSSPLYVVRPQNSPVAVRNSTQQPYVNIISGGRLQQSAPVLGRPAQQSTYYVSSGTNSPVCRFVCFFVLSSLLFSSDTPGIIIFSFFFLSIIIASALNYLDTISSLIFAIEK